MFSELYRLAFEVEQCEDNEDKKFKDDIQRMTSDPEVGLVMIGRTS